MALNIPDKKPGDKLSSIEFNALKNAVISLQGVTGGADYADTEYTDANPFTVVQGIGNKTNLPNNAGNVYDAQKPTYFDKFYDGETGKILGRNGDFFALNIELTARPTSNATNVRLRIAIDIGGDIGEIYPDEKLLTRGNGVSQNLIFPLPVVYTRDTFEANGGIIKVWAENSNVEVFNVRYVFANHHKDRV